MTSTTVPTTRCGFIGRAAKAVWLAWTAPQVSAMVEPCCAKICGSWVKFWERIACRRSSLGSLDLSSR